MTVSRKSHEITGTISLDAIKATKALNKPKEVEKYQSLLKGAATKLKDNASENQKAKYQAEAFDKAL